MKPFANSRITSQQDTRAGYQAAADHSVKFRYSAGVARHFAPHLITGGFAEAFADKGRLSAYNADIPTWVVTAPWTGLLGAAVWVYAAVAPCAHEQLRGGELREVREQFAVPLAHELLVRLWVLGLT